MLSDLCLSVIYANALMCSIGGFDISDEELVMMRMVRMQPCSIMHNQTRILHCYPIMFYQTQTRSPIFY